MGTNYPLAVSKFPQVIGNSLGKKMINGTLAHALELFQRELKKYFKHLQECYPRNMQINYLLRILLKKFLIKKAAY
jgi:hypothetical protein